MQQPNTKRHWAALAVARYYANEGTAARIRDLFPLIEEVVGDPNVMSATLAALNDDDTIDAITAINPDGSKGFAYYPTPITTEDLRDVGEPTELPDGSPVPEGLDTTIPSDRVAAEDDVEAPTRDAPAPDYGPPSPTSGSARDVDVEWRSEEPDAVIEPQEADDGADPDPDDYLDWAAPGQPFHDASSAESLAGGELTQEEWLDVGQRIDDLAAKAARNGLPIIHSALRHLAEKADDGEIDPEIAEMFLRGSTFDPFAESNDVSA